MAHTISFFSYFLNISPYEVTGGFFDFILAGYAVDLFFTVSGFFIGMILYKEMNKIKKINLFYFYWRRITRLYFIWIIFVFFAGALGYFNLLHGVGEINHSYKAFFLIHNLFDVKNSYLPWTWAIAVEFQFYLIAPLVVWLSVKSKYPVLFLCSLCVAVIFIRYFYFSANLDIISLKLHVLKDSEKILNGVYMSPIYRIGVFFMGMILYLVYDRFKGIKFKIIENNYLYFGSLLSISFAIYVFLSWRELLPWDESLFFVDSVIGRQIFALLFSILSLFLLLRESLNKYNSKNKVKEILGKIWNIPGTVSYLIYLIHLLILFPLIPFVWENIVFFESFLSIKYLIFSAGIFVFIVSFVFSCIVYMVLWKPILIWRDKKNTYMRVNLSLLKIRET